MKGGIKILVWYVQHLYSFGYFLVHNDHTTFFSCMSRKNFIMSRNFLLKTILLIIYFSDSGFCHVHMKIFVSCFNKWLIYLVSNCKLYLLHHMQLLLFQFCFYGFPLLLFCAFLLYFSVLCRFQALSSDTLSLPGLNSFVPLAVWIMSG